MKLFVQLIYTRKYIFVYVAWKEQKYSVALR
jgi:hypothetical protein